MEFYPDTIFTTRTGSTYYVDQTMHAISGGALGNTICRYTNTPSFFMGNAGYFELENGRVLSTSAIESVHSHGRNRNASLRRPETHNKKIVCTTKSGSNYIIDLENKTITGGVFKDRKEKLVNNPHFTIGAATTIVTEQSVIRVSPIQSVQTYEEFCKQKAAVNNNQMAYNFARDEFTLD